MKKEKVLKLPSPMVKKIPDEQLRLLPMTVGELKKKSEEMRRKAFGKRRP